MGSEMCIRDRLWRDVYVGCTWYFYELFYEMEKARYLNVENRVHLWALHYIYQPRINKFLRQFTNSWNLHPLRSEKGRTPEQLWVLGKLTNDDDLDEIDDFYGVDWDINEELRGNENHVIVNQIDTPTDDLRQVFSIDPLAPSLYRGVDLYVKVLDMLRR